MNSMYYSIENRSPFLDRIYSNFVTGYQQSIKFKMVPQNQFLENQCVGLSLPVLNNTRKVGFNAPIADLLDLDDPEIRENYCRIANL